MDDEFKQRLWLMLAGLAGGFITLTTTKQDLTMKQRIAYLFSALFVALFITPWACEYFGVHSPNALVGMGFTMGALWQVVVAEGSEWVRRWFAVRSAGGDNGNGK